MQIEMSFLKRSYYESKDFPLQFDTDVTRYVSKAPIERFINRALLI